MKFKGLAICLAILTASIFNDATAQVDTSQAAKPDTTIQEKGKDQKKTDKKRKDEFIVYAGLNFNTLATDANIMESEINLGYHLGFDYKRGKFFYWQVGLRYNNAVYQLKKKEVPINNQPVETSMAIRSLEIPVTGGINFLSAINRIIALRLFISAVPAINLGVGDNDFNYTKDDINSFILYGQGGIGVNVAFIVLEAGYNFGFQDMLKDFESKPGQIFVNLGFRF